MTNFGISLDQLERSNVGPRLRANRIDGGHGSIKVVAGRINVHANTIRGIEGHKNGTTFETLDKIARGVGLTAQQLLGVEPIREPAPEAVVAFLEQYRLRDHQRFEQWTDEMWDRYIEIGQTMGICKDAAAAYFADIIEKEFQAISELRNLIDANRADEALATIARCHSALE